MRVTKGTRLGVIWLSKAIGFRGRHEREVEKLLEMLSSSTLSNCHLLAHPHPPRAGSRHIDFEDASNSQQCATRCTRLLTGVLITRSISAVLELAVVSRQQQPHSSVSFLIFVCLTSEWLQLAFMPSPQSISFPRKYRVPGLKASYFSATKCVLRSKIERVPRG